ncbi:MAG: NAD(P)H-binding protein [Gemmatimonadota bacterium]|nr:NAD(P)H-binding protein [Gemmatimonadota bacterium]
MDVLLAGATGLVGRECLALLLADDAFARVVAITRRPLPPAPRLESHVVDFDRLSEHADLFAVDAIICALGTTIKQAGSEERFRHVDHDYPLTIAKLGLERGAKRFALVSSLGANADSRVFYNRVKGEVERDVLALAYESITIVRPSLLLGDRGELRLGEEIAKRFAWLIPGKYRPVQARAVAAALVRAAKNGAPGRRTIESAEIRSGATNN